MAAGLAVSVSYPCLMSKRVIVIGAGLAGLRTAGLLQEAGRDVILLDAADAPGGRVRTDMVDGFRLDRGFQVLVTEYPEVKAALDLAALDLNPFEPGAKIFRRGHFHTLADPWRKPWEGARSFFGKPGNMVDRVRLASFRSKIVASTEAQLNEATGMSFMESLRLHGFSAHFIDAFFRPWFGGITLDSSLLSDAAFCKFVFRCLSVGDASVPSLGMGAVADQLAARLKPGSLRLNLRVATIHGSQVRLESGEIMESDTIVVATDGGESARLLQIPDPGSKCVTCVWFSAPKAPVEGAWLVLNGEADGLINNVAVMTNVAPSYSSDARALISATALGNVVPKSDTILKDDVMVQMRRWFGAEVDQWRVVRIDRIPHAQPFSTKSPRLVRPGLYVAGDHTQQASAHGALRSGRVAAEAILAASTAA